jgi:hypothetical protein
MSYGMYQRTDYSDRLLEKLNKPQLLDFAYFSVESWFCFTKYENSQDTHTWPTENPLFTCDALHFIKNGDNKQ